MTFPFHFGKIFVFGSNLRGVHGAGAAKEAFERYGARWGQGIGLSGMSYAIPTKDRQIETMRLASIQTHVSDFIWFAKSRGNLHKKFFITPIGTGLAGYSHEQICPLFQSGWQLANCEWPREWKELMS